MVEDIIVIGLSEGEVAYTARPELLEGSPEELLCQLPLHLEVVHNQKKNCKNELC